MGSTQRADKFEQLFRSLKKHYKSVLPPSDRKVLDHLMYACCLEDASYEAADEAFARLQQAYFDSNEVRVTTVAELTESMTSLPRAQAAANRVKKSLQSLFEARYSFDIDDLKKANLGKALEEIGSWQGVTKFVIAYLTQHALGGHAIPVADSILTVCRLLDLITDAEVSKGTLPGVERAIPKSKGLEFASLLHQFAVDHAQSHKNPNVLAVFKDMGMTSKPKAAPPPPKPLPSTKATTPTKPPVTSETSARVVTKGTGPKPPIKVVKDKPLTAPPPAKAEGGPAVKTTKSPSPPPPPASSKTIAAEAKSPVTKKTPVADKAKGAGKKPTTNKPLPIKKGTEKLGTKKKEPPRPAKAKKPPTANKTPGKRLPVKPATKKKSKPR